jgi:hypothetical protein
MEPITIIMFILGTALLVGSCFLHKEETVEPDYDEWIKRLAKRELTEEETERLRQAVDRIISEKTEEVIIKTDDYLSKVANEKIMSVIFSPISAYINPIHQITKRAVRVTSVSIVIP